MTNVILMLNQGKSYTNQRIDKHQIDSENDSESEENKGLCPNIAFLNTEIYEIQINRKGAVAQLK